MIRPSRRQSAPSVLHYKNKVTLWRRHGIRCAVIHQLLEDTYGYSGPYSSIRRFLHQLNSTHPEATTVLDIDPGDVAPVDSGRDLTIKDVITEQTNVTWIHVTVLAWSHRQIAKTVHHYY